MSGKTCDIHSLKINGSRATWQLTPDGLHIMFANNVQRRLAVDAIKSVATSANECIVQLRDAFELGSRSSKTRDNFIASFSHPDGAALFASKIKHAELQTIDISDCPSLQLANGATAYMHDDGVARTAIQALERPLATHQRCAALKYDRYVDAALQRAA